MIEDKPLTRRSLIAYGGSALAAASVPSIVMPGRAAAATDFLAYSTYSNRVGEAFYMRVAGGGKVGMRLLSVTGDDKCFDLLFTPSSSVIHEQATREVSHPALGTTQLFVVPFKTPRTTLRYVVSVNRSR